MAPLVASMRSLAAMLQLASTTKRIRLPVRRTHLALQVVLAEAGGPGRSAPGVAFCWSRRAQRGIEGDVLRAVAGRLKPLM